MLLEIFAQAGNGNGPPGSQEFTITCPSLEQCEQLFQAIQGTYQLNSDVQLWLEGTIHLIDKSIEMGATIYPFALLVALLRRVYRF